ncbi:formylglycine-generating enzyme family protein [Tautonia plasticadhaerens]|uniref:Serine/threonine-protein kinase pkn1 n=1 Tax=Tautonia plasticadhaerens TaxID=2527974 RepID=A0A518H4Q3_9BACT|nr:SUMF1/EgtB/PvdO family nonheme iron enzyme [Tautonia plasticadhaerens]QDV35808.1 Serine/threonine-protein kinase pkn1 [Tautonia plasticadhaerens]
MARLLGGGPADEAGAMPSPRGERVGQFVDELIADGRDAFALLRSTEAHVDEDDARRAWATLGRRMALIPPGPVAVVRGDGGDELVDLPAYYLDRHAVSNRQFSRFVAAGCYDALDLWPREVWPSLLQFTDKAGRPGPAGWTGGKFPAEKADHPVVGVCWYEATAYARWAGKRLPSAAEWQKAGGWPEHLGGGHCTRYPWGDLFDPARANVRSTGIGGTVPVDAMPSGGTPNGIRQMSGNVWEWLDDPLDAIPCRPGESFCPWKPMRRIAGGAFDTYLPGEATCHFVTGQGVLDRRPNIGFRCALSTDRLREPPAD